MIRDHSEVSVPIYYEKMPSEVVRLSDGNLSLMNLEYYRDEYNADSIRFAAVAVEES